HRRSATCAHAMARSHTARSSCQFHPRHPAGRRRARSRSCQPYRHLSCSGGSSRGDRAKMYVASCDRYDPAVVLSDDETTLLVDRLENTAHDASFNLYRHFRAKPGGACNPAFANCGEAEAPVPYTLVLNPGIGEREK